MEFGTMRMAGRIAVDVAARLIAAIGLLRRDRRGSIAIFLGLALVPLIGAIGIGVDTARGFLVRSRLSQALDAAALAGGRVMFEDYRDDDVRMYFASNFPQGYLGATVSVPTITPDADNENLTVTAEATLPATFMRIFGETNITVRASTTINRVNRGMELALVLDNTYSMATNSKMNSLKTAANSLLDVLYGEDDTSSNLTVGVVPFVTMVNIGENREGWTTPRPNPNIPIVSLTRSTNKAGGDATSSNPNTWFACATIDPAYTMPFNDGQLVDISGATQAYFNRRVQIHRTNWPADCAEAADRFWFLFDNGGGTNAPAAAATGTVVARFPPEDFVPGPGYTLTNGMWKGCVEQRFDPRNTLGYDPNDPYDLAKADDPPTARPFFKAFNPSTIGPGGVGLRAYDLTSSGSNAYRYRFTCNTSSSSAGGSTNCDNNWAAGFINEDGPTNGKASNRGPNKGCAVPVLSLQPSRTAVSDLVATMQPWAGGGTNISTGLAWGWRLLSPNYRGLWGGSTPVAQPFDYNTALIDKVVVLLSDGANVILEGEGPGCNGSNDAGTCYPQESEYTGYGRLSADGYNASTLNGALTQSNNRVTTLCNAMKAKNIIIYTIMLEVPDQDIRDIFQACATKPEYYFQATSGDLNAVFKKIGNQLSNLRLAR